MEGSHQGNQLPRVALHSLRHTHASHLIASGLDVWQSAAASGIAPQLFTLSVYGHLFANADDRAATAVKSISTKSNSG